LSVFVEKGVSFLAKLARLLRVIRLLKMSKKNIETIRIAYRKPKNNYSDTQEQEIVPKKHPI
jgi:hypothetical protein